MKGSNPEDSNYSLFRYFPVNYSLSRFKYCLAVRFETYCLFLSGNNRQEFCVIIDFRRENLSVSSSLRPIGSPETSARNYYYTLRNFPEESRSIETILLELKNTS